MYARLAEIGLARGISRNVGADPLELTAANVFQILAFGRGRSGFVKIDRNLEALRDLGPHMARHGYAVFDGDAVNRDKRHDIGRAHARVRALMFGEIDQLGGLPYSANRGFLNGLALADQRNHAAVVVGIHLAVEQIDAGNLHGFDNGIDFGRVAAFGKIRNAFDKSAGHGQKDNGRWMGQATRVRGAPEFNNHQGHEVARRKKPRREPSSAFDKANSNGQTAKLCAARLDSPAAVLLDDSPA